MTALNPNGLLLFFTSLGLASGAFAQDTDTLPSGQQLQEVRVHAFEGGRRLRDLPAPVQYIGQGTLQDYAPSSIVMAVNTSPGVRMEERSPGSYRFNIRGSALRSPFGVRNVKVYFNDLPITDPGGHTYLNQLGYYNFHHLEIIRGPGSSLYGAGTGGALLIESSGPDERPGLFAEYATGSYGLHNAYGRIITGNERVQNKLGYQHQQSEGYRVHSALRRDVLSWTGAYNLEGGRKLKTTFLFGDLFYETPGALTEAEFAADPRAARPGGGPFPSAEAARASIRQQQLLAGVSYEQELLPGLRSKSSAYTQFTSLRNPTIQNYGRSSEAHGGLRSLLSYTVAAGKGTLRFDGGTEWQEGFTTVGLYKNAAGDPDSLRYTDEIRNRQALVFLQATADFGAWSLTGSSSINFLRVRFQRFTPATAGLQQQSFRQWAPRVALLRRFGNWSAWAAWSRGFSPPTTAELLPSGGAINTELSAELGDNYELGVKARTLKRLSFELSAYRFLLRNTIVQRRTAGGGDFFVNAGRTKQQGIEAQARYELPNGALLTEGSGIRIGYTWQHYRYSDFKQVSQDYSGNALPGIAPHTLSAAADLWLKKRFFVTVTYYFSDKLPLNDANTVYADSYHLLGAKLGLQQWWGERFRLKLFVGADNLLNERYSLGNDINGFGGRYYNAAPGRNWYAALVVENLFARPHP
jgi:iron complex outermembrane receptor protein